MEVSLDIMKEVTCSF